ncbi:MAG TPA: hypothetical protein PKD92_00620 [Novosphingobium sp.]|nr:hypothetical protein [Novosphingobium sp.]HMP55062.1 hypothetical protein [Novosphingobium sp.]
MIRRVLHAVVLASAALSVAPAALASEAQAAAPAKSYSVAETPLGTLLDDPAAKAVLVRHIPEIASNPQIAMARSLTLKQVQAFAGGMLSDEALGKIDWDLSKLPAR